MSCPSARPAWPRVCLLVVVCLAASVAAADNGHGVDIPYLTGRVVDNANVIEATARGRIADYAKAHEQATTNQVVVLTVPTIGSSSIEDYAVRVFEAWKLGQKGKDNGVLIVVAPTDRKMRIEVGYGLESTLTDGQCGEIIRSVMTPRFKDGDYTGGIEEGVKAVVGRLEGKSGPVETPHAAPKPTSFSGIEAPDMPWPQRILFGAFIFGIIGLFTVIGVLTPRTGWFLYFFLIPFWALFPIVIVGGVGTLALLATYVIGFPVAKLLVRRRPWYAKAAADLKSQGTARIGGFTIGGSSGSSGFSSSGFSGGGGCSGGGGASGSW
jgi:uncharacterized protein